MHRKAYAHVIKEDAASSNLLFVGTEFELWVSIDGGQHSKPRSMDTFLVLYTNITKEDIRRNRGNASERLGFLGRIIHGTNARAWFKEMRQHLGEKIEFDSAVAATNAPFDSQTKCNR